MKKELTCLDGSKIAFRLQEEADSDELILYVDVYTEGGLTSSPVAISEAEKEIREAIISLFQKGPS